MRRPATALFLAATIILSAAQVRSYTHQYTDASNSIQVKWPTNTIAISLSSSLLTQQPNIKAGSDVTGAVMRALGRWEKVANIRFIVSASELQSASAPGTRGDGVSLVTVAPTSENAAPFNGNGSEMSGRTRIFSTVSGSITEADIFLNPAQPFSSDGTVGTYDLEATFTHELGHLLGLEHSAMLGATMQPRQCKNGLYEHSAAAARSLSEDDRAGVAAIYGARLGSGRRGSVAGIISFSSGAPVFGANVWAEDLVTGRIFASNITVANGSYQIEGLRPGSYRIIAQALGGVVSAAEIASPRGAYAGLLMNQPLSFRTEEIGRVDVTAGVVTSLNAQLSGSTSLLNPSFLGINGRLSTIAVPLTPARLYKIFIAGEGISASQLSKGGISTASPFIVVDQTSVADVNFGNKLSVVSFDVLVSQDAPAGDYSLRLQSLNGEVAYIMGGLTISEAETAAGGRIEMLIDAIETTDTSPDDVSTGG